MARTAAYRKANPEKVAESKKKARLKKLDAYKAKASKRYVENKEEVLAQCAVYRAANREKIIARNREYNARNRQKKLDYQRKYEAENKEAVRNYRKQYVAERMNSDPVFAMSYTVRRRIAFALKKRGFQKNGTTQKMLGCDFSTLVAHLESRFQPGMSWDNRSEWHVDHRKPLASAETIEQLEALCHYTNLQPLWAADNLSKGAKMPEEFK